MAMQMKKPEEKAHASSVIERAYSTGDRSVDVVFSVSGPEWAVREFLQKSRSLDSLENVIGSYGRETLSVSCEINGQRITNPAAIVPAIKERLGVQ